MKTNRIDEYHKHGCHFYGTLVSVDYMEDLKNDSNFGKFNAGVTLDYAEKAKKMVEDKGYKVKRVLLSIPEYVVEIS